MREFGYECLKMIGPTPGPGHFVLGAFRLLAAAMAASGMRTLAEAAKFEWPIHLAVGDSLIKARQLELTLGGDEDGTDDLLASFAYATEDIHDQPRQTGRAARESVGDSLVLPDVDPRAVRGLKFSAALPERLAAATVAARLADFDSARAVLSEPVRFQQGG